MKTLVAALVLATAACGGGSTASPASDTTPAVDVPATGLVPDTGPDSVPDSVPDSASATAPATAPATSAPAPTTTDAPPTEPFDLADLPDLVADIEAALGGTGEPLALARALGGFPLDIPAPEGSTLYDVSSRFERVEQGTRETSFQYWAAGPGGNVPDVDINLDDDGPGSLQILDVYGPIMGALGFERNAGTTSDPGEPGGPNSVNHVFVPSQPVGTFNGVAGSVGRVFIWTDEDINGGSYSGEQILGGYRIDLEIDTSEDAPIPIPLLEALAAALPAPDGMVLVAGELRVQRRSADSFAIERGSMYVAVRLNWEAPADAFADIVAFYADAQAIADPLMAAEASFFNEGEYEPAVMYEYDGTDQRLPLLLLQRYEGLLGIDAPDEAGGPVTVTLDIDLDSIAPILSAPSD